MLKIMNTIQVNCDNDDVANQGYCWEEMILNLEPGETKKDVIEFLQKLGWSIIPETKIVDNSIQIYNYRCMCPFCESGIFKEDIENEIGDLEI